MLTNDIMQGDTADDSIQCYLYYNFSLPFALLCFVLVYEYVQYATQDIR